LDATTSTARNESTGPGRARECSKKYVACTAGRTRFSCRCLPRMEHYASVVKPEVTPIKLQTSNGGMTSAWIAADNEIRASTSNRRGSRENWTSMAERSHSRSHFASSPYTDFDMKRGRKKRMVRTAWMGSSAAGVHVELSSSKGQYSLVED